MNLEAGMTNIYICKIVLMKVMLYVEVIHSRSGSMAGTSCDCGCWMLISGQKPTASQFAALTN